MQCVLRHSRIKSWLGLRWLLPRLPDQLHELGILLHVDLAGADFIDTVRMVDLGSAQLVLLLLLLLGNGSTTSQVAIR